MFSVEALNDDGCAHITCCPDELAVRLPEAPAPVIMNR